MIIPILFCLSVITKRTITADDDFIIIHPEPQSAPLYSTITLYCRVKVMPYLDVHWVKDGFGIGNGRDNVRHHGRLKNKNVRYDLPFDISQGEYDLRITDLELSDDGEFHCEYLFTNGTSYLSKKANVTVLVPSLAPTIKQRGKEKLHSSENPIILNKGDKKLILDCNAKNGRPGAILTWYINNNAIFPGKIDAKLQPSSTDIKLFDSASTLTLNVSTRNNGDLVKCSANNTGYESQGLISAMSTIIIHTVPVVKMEASPQSKNWYVENDIVEFSCTATGRPNEFSWRWYLKGKILPNIKVNIYKVRMDRTMHNSNLECMAESTKTGVATKILSVKYGPRFIDENPVVYSGSIGGDVIMSCDVTSNPVALISWQKEFNKEILSRDVKLFRNNLEEEDFGAYRCTAKLKGFPTISKISYLIKKKAPTIQEPSVSHGREGKSARLSCSIDSVPIPKEDEIKWLFRRTPLLRSTRHLYHREIYIGGVIAVLKIVSLHSEDFGVYHCLVNTTYGSANATVILLKRDDGLTLIIIGASIIFISTLIVIGLMLRACGSGTAHQLKEKGYNLRDSYFPIIPINNIPRSAVIRPSSIHRHDKNHYIPNELDLKDDKVGQFRSQNQNGKYGSQTDTTQSEYINAPSSDYCDRKRINEYDVRFQFNPSTQNLNKYIANMAYSPIYKGEGKYGRSKPIYSTKKNKIPKQKRFPADFYPSTKPTNQFKNPNEKIASNYASVI